MGYEESKAKRAETVRRKLTDEQRIVLQLVADAAPRGEDVSTLHIHHTLYDGPHNEWPGSGRQRWASRNEAAQPYLAALTKKRFLERPSRGYITITDEGRERLKED